MELLLAGIYGTMIIIGWVIILSMIIISAICLRLYLVAIPLGILFLLIHLYHNFMF